MGYIDRNNFLHWGSCRTGKVTYGVQRGLPSPGVRQGAMGCPGRAARNPRIVFEHPGEATIPDLGLRQ